MYATGLLHDVGSRALSSTGRVVPLQRIAAERSHVVCRAESRKKGGAAVEDKTDKSLGLGDLLGPIGLTLGGALRRQVCISLL